VVTQVTVRDVSGTPLEGVMVTVSGGGRGQAATDPKGVATLTLADGSYRFDNLRPGTYAIAEAQPAGYLDGKDTIGTQGGSSATQDQFTNVGVASGTTGTDNNFGELVPASLAGSGAATCCSRRTVCRT